MDSTATDSPAPRSEPRIDPRMAWTCLLAAIGVIVFHCLLLAFQRDHTLELVPVAVLLLGAAGLIRMDVVSSVLKLIR